MGDGSAEKQCSVHDWTFLSNHATVLLCIAKEPGLRVRDVADRVGITNRAVLRILAELEEAGYLSRMREGRRNRYKVHAGLPLRHPVAAHRDISSLLDLVWGRSAAAGCDATACETLRP